MIQKLTQHTVIRYIISGGTSASFDLAFLYLLHHLLKIQYLWAAIIAFLGAFCVSFVLHKFWTFKNRSTHNIHKETVLYLASSLFGLGFNTLLMYLFVSHLHLNVILAQIITGGIVACFTFFLSRKVFSQTVVPGVTIPTP